MIIKKFILFFFALLFLTILIPLTVKAAFVFELPNSEKITRGILNLFERPLRVEKFQITDDSHQENQPAIFGNYVVYADWGGDETGVDLRIYDLSKKFSKDKVLVADEGAQSNPDIWGVNVVYQSDTGDDSNIYGINTINKKKFPIAVISGSNQVSPAIFGDLVVWSDNRNGNYDIYGYSLITKQEFQITNDPQDNYNPRIWGNKVVWYSKVSGGYYNVEGYDLLKKEEFQISSKNNGYQQTPDIYNNKVVWVDSENSNQIYLKDLATGEENILTAGADIRPQFGWVISLGFQPITSV